jgi:hypothetical protein
MLLLLFLAPFAVYFVYGYRQWLRTPTNARQIGLRTSLSLIASALVAASLVLFVYTGVRARTNGGFPFYAPLLLSCIRSGFVLGALGFVFALPSKGPLRWPTVILAVMVSASWLIVATNE